MTLLAVHDLQVVVRGGMAVDGVSFSLAAGEVLALVGESGAGKSLTAAAVIGLLPHGSRMKNGRILLDGERIDESSRRGWRRIRGRRIGAVFQDASAGLDPLQTIGVQLTQTLRAHRSTLRGGVLQERVADWLQLVGLTVHHAAAYPHELPQGERQRAAMAMAMAPMPDVLIADEPVSSLDPPQRTQLAALLGRLARAQRTSVLLISNDVRTAQASADRLAVMYAGRIVEAGPTDTVLRYPRHPYVHDLFACTPGLATPGKPLPAIAGRMPAPGSAPRGCVYRLSCFAALEQCRAERPAQLDDGPACFNPLPDPRVPAPPDPPAAAAAPPADEPAILPPPAADTAPMPTGDLAVEPAPAGGPAPAGAPAAEAGPADVPALRITPAPPRPAAPIDGDLESGFDYD